MRVFILSAIFVLEALTSVTSEGVHGGTVLSGPSGIVTNQGAIGPAALGLDGYGAYGGHAGAFGGGPLGPSAFTGGPFATPAFFGGPAMSYASLLGPAAGFGGHGLGLASGGAFGGFGGYGPLGGYRSGLGLAPGVSVTNGGGIVGVGHHGVMVKGPPTVPATIAGPAGKVVANGLYGVPTPGHGGW